MKSVFVTGATGFIGGHVVRNFAQRGYRVTCAVRSNTVPDNLKSFANKFVRADVTDLSSLTTAISGHDSVINLAGLTRAIKKEFLYDVNSTGASNVAKACAAQAKPPVLVHVSSLAAAGPCINHAPRKETDQNLPVSNYGKSKLLGERAIASFADRVPTTILRPGIVVGEGDTVGFEFFKGVALANLIVIPSFRNRIFSIIHADDLAAAIVLTAQQGERVNGENGVGFYGVAGPEQWTLARFGKEIGKVMEKKFVIPFYNANTTIWIAGLLYELLAKIRKKTLPMNLDKAREATAGSWHIDSTKLMKLGFTAQPLPKRLDQTYRWYLDNGFLKRTGAGKKTDQYSSNLGQLKSR